MPDRIDAMVARAVELSFSRSGGSGGQNVNKVNTKVTAKLAIDDLVELTDSQRSRIRERLSNRVNAEGRIVIHAQEEREQHRNRQVALRRLSSLVRYALKRTKPRRKTEPTRASRERRLAEKKRHADRKRNRRAPRPE